MTITVVRDPTARMRHEIQIGPHKVAIDASVADGGEGLGPNPHDLYDAALGACEALTVLWYANRKHLAVETLSVSVDRDQTEEHNGTYRLHSTFKIGGKLTEAQRQELLSVAARCPIHKLMTSVQTIITVSLE